MVFANGDLYEGTWQAGVKHGDGKYRWKQGSFYEGQFWMDRREGGGKITYGNGLTVEGYWRNDIRLENGENSLETDPQLASFAPVAED